METTLLNPDECLVYVENIHPFADVSGTTQIAKILRTPLVYFDNGDVIQNYDLELMTDVDGDILDIPEPITVTENNILTNRPNKDIQPRKFYNFTNLTATNFVIKKNLTKPIESTSRTALGSGIQGIYVSNQNTINSYASDVQQEIYVIEVPNALIVQDKEHGESITVASLNTNRYLDKIINSLQNNARISAKELIRLNNIDNLSTLWNIVLYRVNNYITKSALEKILIRYCDIYMNDTMQLKDTTNGNSLEILPINLILTELGYDGIIGTDSYINGWNRGCYSYNFENSSKIEGSVARY